MEEFFKNYVRDYVNTFIENEDINIAETQKEKIVNNSVAEICNDDYIWSIIDDIILNNIKNK